MIDFRYHFVSLMAVLIALTVGVVLGAGPLQGTLVSTLNSQVTRLSDRQSELTQQSEELKKEVNARNDYINGLAKQELPGKLKGAKVAVVRMYNTSDTDAAETIKYLKQANASIVSDVTLTSDWFAKSNASIRNDIVNQIKPDLDTAPVGNASVAHTLSQGLYQVLSAPSDKSTHIAGLLASKTKPLVTVTTPAQTAADAVIIIFNRDSAADKKDSPSAAENQMIVDLGQAAVDAKLPTVMVGEAKDNGDAISVVREASLKVSTVDSIGRVTALVSAPLALGQAIDGKPVAVGYGQGASTKVPSLQRKSEEE